MAIANLAAATGRLVARRPGTIVSSTFVVTLFFAAVLIFSPAVPSSDSFEGNGEAVAAEDRLDENLPPNGFAIPFIVTGLPGGNGNMLARETFDEILLQEARLRVDATTKPYVFTYTHPHLQMRTSSVWGLPDTMRAVMNGDSFLSYAVGWHRDVGGPGTSYAAATDAEWQDALTRLLTFEPTPGERPFLRAVSVDAVQVDGTWTARSLFMVPTLRYADITRDYAPDAGSRTPGQGIIDEIQLHVQGVLEDGVQHTDWVGLGLAINTEIQKEITESGRLVGVSFLLIGVFLYLTLRNFRDFLAAYLALPVVIIWMLGAARLLGLSYNQFTAMLPVLILALGVDFAIHGVRRYREERAHYAPGTAVTRSVSLLGPALVLAAGTTATAFLSNAFSDVTALRDWGIEGGVAILGALWICGVHTPALRHLWDKRRQRKGKLSDDARASVTARRLEQGTALGRVARSSGKHPAVALVVLAIITVPAIILATQIESDFNADDFLDDKSELIRGVGLVARDFPAEGEPAIWLVEADVADPAVLVALDEAMRGLDARGYKAEFDFSLVRIVQTVMQDADENGASNYVDANGDDLPDRRADISALYANALRDGVHARVQLPVPVIEVAPGVPAPAPLQPNVPSSQRVLVYAPETVRQLLHPAPGGGYDMTAIYFGIPGTEDFANVPAAADAVREAGATLYAMDSNQVQRLTLTGEPYKRLEMVNAITASLKISITLSIVVVFLIVLAVFRDFLYAAITVIPVLVLVAWLFAFMVLIGLSLNMVTVTVAAMAIGVGIDYSIHITERFREEVLQRERTRLLAIRRAMDSSGIALLGSAVTTVVGFLVLTMAPMPLFATFGLITAAMAAASFLAAATLLPPFLVLVDRWRRPELADE